MLQDFDSPSLSFSSVISSGLMIFFYCCWI